MAAPAPPVLPSRPSPRTPIASHRLRYCTGLTRQDASGNVRTESPTSERDLRPSVGEGLIRAASIEVPLRLMLSRMASASEPFPRKPRFIGLSCSTIYRPHSCAADVAMLSVRPLIECCQDN
jgi:hypothetical protein